MLLSSSDLCLLLRMCRVRRVASHEFLRKARYCAAFTPEQALRPISSGVISDSDNHKQTGYISWLPLASRVTGGGSGGLIQRSVGGTGWFCYSPITCLCHLTAQILRIVSEMGKGLDYLVSTLSCVEHFGTSPGTSPHAVMSIVEMARVSNSLFCSRKTHPVHAVAGMALSVLLDDHLFPVRGGGGLFHNSRISLDYIICQ